MIILYIMLVAYILAINFYAFLLVKSLRDKEKQDDINKQAAPIAEFAQPSQNGVTASSPQGDKFIGKLLITGLLGGAIAIYACMFIFKFQRSNLLLMVLMPLLGVLNVYLFVLMFRSGFGFLLIR
jgi:hypothetical protein